VGGETEFTSKEDGAYTLVTDFLFPRLSAMTMAEMQIMAVQLTMVKASAESIMS
jgi:hypothetical protein